MSEELTMNDKKLLNHIQFDFPIVPRPFQEIGKKLGMSEQEVIDGILRAKNQKVLRQLSAIYDTRRIGYKSMLAAVSARQDKIDEVAQMINRHPGVSHNYERTHEFNIWFTIAVPPESDLQAHIKAFELNPSVKSIRQFPTLKLFKIGVRLDVAGEYNLTAEDEEAKPMEMTAAEIDEKTRRVVLATQDDIEIVPNTFELMAGRAGMSVDDLISALFELKKNGILRRFAAILRHQKAGFVANLMAVWKVPHEKVDELGPRMAATRAVSHAYQRPVYPDWPYNVFTMIHGKSKEDCETIAAHISEKTGVTDYAKLYSTREFKKTRVRYFDQRFRQWEEQNLHSANAQ